MRYNYLRFNPKGENSEMIADVVRCYQEVFSTLPWSEWKKCPICNQKWGLEEREELVSLDFHCCGEPVCNFWQEEEVLGDIYKEVKDDSSCWIVLLGNQVVGFTWGYPISVTELEKKLNLKVADRIRHLFGDVETVAYKDEIGIKKQFRGQGIAQELFRRRINDFKAKGLKVVTSRTKKNPPAVTYLWYSKLGFKEVAWYNDPDEKVVMGAYLHEL